MRLSFMTFACPEWPIRRIVHTALRLGYHGVEFRCDAKHAHGVEVTASSSDRRTIRKWLTDSGVEACCLATSLRFADDKVIEAAPSRIELAADIGCPALRVFCGPIPEGLDLAGTIDKVASNLREVAPIAAQAGVQLWLETHDTMCKAAPAAAAVRAANHPAVGLNYDNMHPFRLGESLTETETAITGLVRHTHFHDSINSPDTVVIKPIGEGELPIDDMFRMLVAMDYRGYLSGEWFNDQYGPDPESSLARFHSDMTNLASRFGVTLGAA